jgi:hypothetical protein
MENSFQTSFIPKKPIVNNGNTSGPKGATSIFMVGSVFIIFITGLIAGGLYFYKDYLQKNKDQLYSSLLKIKDSFNENTIAELGAYDKKSTVAKQVLDNHLVLSPLFQAINDYTLSTIQYTKFDHTSANDILSVKMSGNAHDYKSIALQADVYTKNKPDIFNNLVFSNLTKDKNNFVTFDVDFTVDKKALLYSGNIKNIITPENTITNNPDISSLENNSITQNVNQPLEVTGATQ